MLARIRYAAASINNSCLWVTLRGCALGVKCLWGGMQPNRDDRPVCALVEFRQVLLGVQVHHTTRDDQNVPHEKKRRLPAAGAGAAFRLKNNKWAARGFGPFARPRTTSPTA